jgi:hypothetical protein
MKKSTKIGAPVAYRGCYIVPANDGFDVVDRTTGRWIHQPSQRLAKWNATVWTRLSTEFDTSLPQPVVNMVKWSTLDGATK